jgi:hypothetical protein
MVFEHDSDWSFKQKPAPRAGLDVDGKFALDVNGSRGSNRLKTKQIAAWHRFLQA